MRHQRLFLTSVMMVAGVLAEAGPASGTFTADKSGAISPTHAIAYAVRNSRNARTMQTELLLTDVPVEAAEVQAALDPHMIAINLDAIKDRNYVLLWVSPDGTVSMNATFSKTMTQYLNNTAGGLRLELTTNTAARLEGRVFSPAPLKTMDGTTYRVDLTFAAELAPPVAGTPLPAGGGDAGKALTALLAAVAKKNWPAIRAAASPAALKMFDRSYNTVAENVESTADLLNAWLPKKARVAGGQLRGDTAILDVEGEIFEGQRGLSLVRMVKSGAMWQFDQAARAGFLP